MNRLSSGRSRVSFRISSIVRAYTKSRECVATSPPLSALTTDLVSALGGGLHRSPYPPHEHGDCITRVPLGNHQLLKCNASERTLKNCSGHFNREKVDISNREKVDF
jgi:hypothetical protein